MTNTERSAELARHWIEAWIRLDLEWLRQRLAPDFVHVSPFGRLEGRDAYLETVEPLARKSVRELTIKDVIASGHRAAVWFENRTARGVVDSCDWVWVEKDLIKKIRDVLSPAEQERLDGAG